MQREILGGFADVVLDGGPLIFQVPATTVNLPGTIAASGTFTTGAIVTNGMPHMGATAKMTQDGTLIVQRYFDSAASISVGSAITQALSANTQSPIVEVNDGKIFQSLKASLVNGGSVAATPSNITIVMAGR